jgi:hypothetical protein
MLGRLRRCLATIGIQRSGGFTPRRILRHRQDLAESETWVLTEARLDPSLTGYVIRNFVNSCGLEQYNPIRGVAVLRLFDRDGGRNNRALPLLVILLTFLISTAEASHVHPAAAKAPTHSCSICSAAHSGVRIERVYVPAPLISSAESVRISDDSPRSLLVLPDLFIRPPPLV